MKNTIKNTLTKYPIYPILFSVYPVLHMYLGNTRFVSRDLLVRPLVVSVTLFALIYALLSRLFKSTRKGALATSLAILLFYSYGRILYVSPDYAVFNFKIQSYVVLYYIYFGVFITALIYIKISSDVSLKITRLLNILSVFLLVITFITNSTYSNGVLGTSAENSQRIAEEFKAQTAVYNPKLKVSTTPDIYYIILDGHTRSDILKEKFDVDNNEFISDLEDLGFFVADKSNTNYIQTRLSLASSLSMEYLDKLPPLVGEKSDDVTSLDIIRSDSVVVNKLVTAGYQKVYVNGAWTHHYNDLLALEEAGLGITTSQGQSSSYLNLLEKSVIATTILTNPTKDIYDLHRLMVLDSYRLGKKIPLVDKPTITYMHVLPPHPPFIWDEFGNPRGPGEVIFDIGADGDHFEQGASVYYHGYRNAVAKIDALTLELVQGIIRDSPEPPIIIIQGDHGSGAGLVWEDGETSDLEDRFAILNAYYLPGIDTSELPKNVSPVNTFRYVFNKYFGTEYPLLENKYYFSKWSTPYEFVDVTDRIVQYQNED